MHPVESVEFCLSDAQVPCGINVQIFNTVDRVDSAFKLSEHVRKKVHLFEFGDAMAWDVTTRRFVKAILDQSSSLTALSIQEPTGKGLGYSTTYPHVTHMYLRGTRICLEYLADLCRIFPNIRQLKLFGELCPFKCCAVNTRVFGENWKRSLRVLSLGIQSPRHMKRPFKADLLASQLDEVRFYFENPTDESKLYLETCLALKPHVKNLVFDGEPLPELVEAVVPHETWLKFWHRGPYEALLKRNYCILSHTYSGEDLWRRPRVILQRRKWMLQLARWLWEHDLPMNKDALKLVAKATYGW
jgi:hypothetical protein